MSPDEEDFITSRRRRFAIVLGVFATAACGDAPAPPAAVPPASAPAPTPTPVPAAPVDPDAEPAARGEHRVKDLLESCKRDCVEAFRMQDPDEKAVLERLKTVDANPWADAAEWRTLSNTVSRIRERNARIKSDPRFLEAERKANWVRENVVFKDVGLTRVFADPYLIFQEVKHQDERDTKRVYDDKKGAFDEAPIDGTSNPAKVRQNEVWAAKGELLAKRDAVLLVEMHRRFRELFADEFKLPTLASSGRMLTVLVMWNRASFDNLLHESGAAVSPGTRGFYSPPQQKVFTYIGDEGLMRLDEIPCADGFLQKASDQALLHCATLQLLHEYAAIARGKPLSDSDTNVPLDVGPIWLPVGVAEFLCVVETDKADDLDGAKWRHERIALDRVMEAQRSRVDAEKWTLSELTKQASVGDVLVAAGKAESPTMSSLFCVRAWAFVHFLWNYDAGKHREKFVAFVGQSLHAPTTSAQFAKSMGCKDAAHWGAIELEFDWYWNELLDRRIGKDKKTLEWPKPSTDAPTGRVEDDAAFCDAWNAKHALGAKPGGK